MNVTYVLPGKIAGEALRADQRLYNDLIDYFETIAARWARQNISTGQHLLIYQAHFGTLILIMILCEKEDASIQLNVSIIAPSWFLFHQFVTIVVFQKNLLLKMMKSSS